MKKRISNKKYIWVVMAIILFFLYITICDHPIICVEKGSDIQSISTSYFNSCYVTREGELFTMGLNLNKTYSNDTVLTSPVLIHTETKVVKAVTSLNAILYYDEYGDMFIIGMTGIENGEPQYSSEPIMMSNVKNVVDIAAGEMHYMALDVDGNVWTWGKNNCKQTSLQSTERYINKPIKQDKLKDIKGIECGYYTSCAYSDDSIILWGEDSFGLTGESSFSDMYVMGLRELQQVSIGRNHILVEADGKILGYGSNCFGQMGEIDKEFFYGEALDIDVTQDLKFVCGYTSSIFRMKEEIYYLGDINPFSQEEAEKVAVISKLDTGDARIVDVDINAFHLVYISADNIYYMGDSDYGQCGIYVKNNGKCEKRDTGDNLVAVLDTGFDTNNATLIKALCSTKQIDEETTYANCSMFNLIEGKEEVFDNVLADGHGTAMISSIIGVEYDDKLNLSFNQEIEILSLKVMDEKGGKFIDFITGLRISEFRQAIIANCSLSISGEEYEPFIKYIADNMHTMIIFAMSNSNCNNSIIVDSEKILYVMDKQGKYENEADNIIYIDSGNITVILPGNRLATMNGNSIAASIISNRIIENISLFDDITFCTILESNLFG